MNPFGQLSINTTKGQALMAAGVAVVRGNKEFSVWAQTGVMVDRDSLIIDGDGVAPLGTNFEFVTLATDSTFDVLTFWDNTDPEVSQVLVGHSLVVGDYVVTEVEISRVIFVGGVDGDTVGFQRGVAGTTIAAHSTGTDPILIRSVVALTAGAVVVPMTAVTAEEAIDTALAIIAERAWLGRNGQNNFRWEILKLTAARALIISTVVGDRGALFDETLTNGTLLPAVGQNGSSHASMPVHTLWRAPTDAEVTDAVVVIPVPFKPVHATVLVFTTAVSGTLLAWDGAILFDHVANTVTLDNTGAADWTAVTFISVIIHGETQSLDTLVGE
jgi:hypothetical protein